MAMDLKQVMAGVLTISMFIMLGNMIKRDHIDPLLEPLPVSSGVQYNILKVSKPGMVKLSEINYSPWNEDKVTGKPCWNKPSFKGKEQSSNGYIFFSLTNGPEYHASQIANAVTVARHLGAVLALPDITDTKFEQKWKFGEIYDVDKFMTSLDGIVRVDKNPHDELSNERLSIVRVPNRVSENFIDLNIKPIFQSKRKLWIITYFNTSIFTKEKENKLPNAHQCMAMFESLKLQVELHELVDSMLGTLRSLSQKMRGLFIVVDLKVEIIGKNSCQKTNGSIKRCYNAEEIAEFLKKIGFHTDTTIYLTQTGWHKSLNALRDVFPNTFTKDAIMPADEKAKFTSSETHKYEKFIDYYMCTQGDVFVPTFPSRFYAGVVGERIAIGKTQILVPARKTSVSASDYISPFIARKSHIAHSCFC